jgi:hypothetical protein
MIRIIELILGQSRAEFRIGSISEQIALNTPGSGDERKAEPICRLIDSVFSSQFGQGTKPLLINRKQLIFHAQAVPFFWV